MNLLTKSSSKLVVNPLLKKKTKTKQKNSPPMTLYKIKTFSTTALRISNYFPPNDTTTLLTTLAFFNIHYERRIFFYLVHSY